MAKVFRGIVTSTKMEKTVTVEVGRQKAHSLYGKVIRLKRKYHVHDELGAKVGDEVIFVEGRPVSKTKKWRMTKIVGESGGKMRKKSAKRKEKGG